MIVTILALIIGILVAGAGIYYMTKEKEDAESRKIYTIAAVVGAVLAVGALLKLFL